MKNCITKLEGIYIPNGSDTKQDNRSRVAALLTQMGRLGYRADDTLISALLTLTGTELVSMFDKILNTLSEITGNDVKHVCLFPSFPENIPEIYSYALTTSYGVLPVGVGIAYDTETRTLTYVDDQGTEPQEGQFALDTTKVTYKTLTHITNDDVVSEITRMLGQERSMSVSDKALLIELVGVASTTIALPKFKAFKENLPVMADLLEGSKHQLGFLKSQMSGATDALRIATGFSGGDTSLSENTKFKLKNSHRVLIMSLVEGMKNMEEDMMRHRDKWLRLGEVLHPRKPRNAKRFPQVAEAFDALRNTPKEIWTFQRRMHELVQGTSPLNTSDMKLLKTRPTVVARDIDALLRNGGNEMAYMALFAEIANKVDHKVLMQLWFHFDNRNSDKPRYFIPKGVSNKMNVTKDYRKPLSVKTCDTMKAIITNALLEYYGNAIKSESFSGDVFIDPKFYDRVLPFNTRGDSESSANFDKGSKVDLNHDGVIRMFVYWAKARDIDLSMMAFDEKWSSKGHISYTNLRDGLESAHSGDITSGYNGASEFIDFDISKYRKAGIRYVVMNVLSYSGETFDSMECFTGFMKRDGLKTGEVFEPATVEHKFNLTQNARSSMPLIFDLVDGKVIFADVCNNGRSGNNIEGNAKMLKDFAEVYIDMTNTKPTMGFVLELVVAANGGTVIENRDDGAFEVKDMPTTTFLENFVDV